MSGHRRAVIAVVAAAGVASAAVWWRAHRPAGPEPPPPPTLVVVVSIDTLRADHLGFHGYGRPTSPHLDALAAESVIFEDATSPAPWTLPAHASLLTGLYPSHHTLISHTQYLPSSIPTLGTLFSAQGFVTAAVVNSHNLGPRYGLERGFREFLYVEETADQRAPSTRITDRALEWLAAHGQGRLFLFVHSYDVHSDYRSRPEYERLFVGPYDGRADGSTAQLVAARRGDVRLDDRDAAHLVDLYDAGVRQMDEELGRLWAALRERDPARTLLAVTSDHGEEFLERGGVLHGRTQFQEVVRVPLILRGAGLPAGRRITAPVSLVDVAPTVLSLAGVPAPASLDGAPLLDIVAGRTPSRGHEVFGEADHNNEQEDVTRMVRRRDHKLHYDRRKGGHRLFDLRADPAERTDVAGAQRDTAEDLLRRLRAFMATAREGRPRRALSPDQIEKLRALGYVN